MVKLTAIKPKGGAQILLRFSDGACGVYDFAPFIATDTEMTKPLSEPAFFVRHFIEAGALAWPNGFDLSAESLYRHLQVAGELHRDAAAP